MPKLSLVGSASSKSFGLLSSSSGGTVSADYIVVGGGGLSGYGGAGGGQVIPTSAVLSTSTSYTVTVGGIGSASVFNSTTAAAGSNGNGASPATGGASGSGYNGGYGQTTWFAPIPGTAPWTEGGYALGDGGGGGAGGLGGSASNLLPGAYYQYGGDGGRGVQWSINSLYYGAGSGGSASSYSYTDGPQPNASGGSNGVGYGNFGSGGMAGGVIISYVSATQLYTGGTVTSTGSGASTRWSHSFSSSGTLTHL